MILWSFSSIDRASVAESLVRQHLCKPYVKQCFSEKTTNELSQILNSLLDLVPTYISPLQNVIDGRHNEKSPIYGFDFITNRFFKFQVFSKRCHFSVFPEIVSGLQRYLPSLFIPSENVHDFRERYILSMDFLDQLERQCSSQSSVIRLRSEQRYYRDVDFSLLPISVTTRSTLLSPLKAIFQLFPKKSFKNAKMPLNLIYNVTNQQMLFLIL